MEVVIALAVVGIVLGGAYWYNKRKKQSAIPNGDGSGRGGNGKQPPGGMVR